MIDYSKTQHLIEAMVSERIVPGANYAFLNGRQVFTSTLGFSTIYPKLGQLSPFALYDLASLTKVLATENVLLHLYDQGKLNFSEKLADFVPAFTDRRITLQHLLTHTSGIRGWIPHRDQLSHDELLKAIVDLPVTDEFNRKMRYADTNFILLGLVIKAIYHQPVQTVSQLLLQEMGLKHATFSPNPSECIPTALVDGKVLQGIPHDPKARQLGSDCGSAGLFADMGDLITFSQGILGQNLEVLPYSQQTVKQLFFDRTPSGVKPRAWGWDLRFDPADYHPVILHTGFTGTLIILDRQKQSGLILLTNRVHPTGHNTIFLAMRKRIIDTFLAENSKK